MSGSTGDNLTVSGRVEARRHARTSSARPLGSAPNSSPPAFVFGQEALTSNAVITWSGVSRSMTRT